MRQIGTKKMETERLILRKLTKNDAKEAFNNWCGRENVDKYVLFTKHATVDVTKALYEKWEEEYEDMKTYRWIVQIKETKELIGTIDVSKKFLDYGTCEIGYCYGDKYWNKGYGTEALKAVLKYLFEECDAELVYAEHLEDNLASGMVMKKAGMQYEGRLRSRVIDKSGKRNDLLSYSITKEDYFNNKQKNSCFL